MKTLQNIPNNEMLFTTIFNHQEEVKGKYGITNDDTKNKYGGNVFAKGGEEDFPVPVWFKPWVKSNTVKGRTSSTGKITTFDNNDPNKLYKNYNYWVEQNNGNEFSSPQEFQKFIYNKVKSEDPTTIDKMWKDYGKTSSGNFDDGIFGRRTADLMDWRTTGNTNINSSVPDAFTKGIVGAFTNTIKSNTTPSKPEYKSETGIDKPVEASDFNKPLEWYDTAGDIMGLLNNSRIQVPLEQLDRKDLRYREQNPLPTIQQGQEDYNALVSTLPQGQIGFANQANLYGKKYSLNNQTFGQYENINKTGAMNVDAQNNQNQYQLDTANLGLRDQFNQRVLQGKEIQQENKLKLFNNLFTKIAQNKAFNTNGDLLLQMTPYFNQEGKFNNNKYRITSNSNTTPNSYQKTITKGGATRYKPNS
jgi:hypothetical protein